MTEPTTDAGRDWLNRLRLDHDGRRARGTYGLGVILRDAEQRIPLIEAQAAEAERRRVADIFARADPEFLAVFRRVVEATDALEDDGTLPR